MVKFSSWTRPWPVGGACDWGGKREVCEKEKKSLVSSSLGQSAQPLPDAPHFRPHGGRGLPPRQALGC